MRLRGENDVSWRIQELCLGWNTDKQLFDEKENVR